MANLPGFSNIEGKAENAIYNNFRTPFFKLAVATNNKNNFIELPIQITKLVQSIELQEHSGGCARFSQLVIKLAEGSREPYIRNSSTPDYDSNGFEFSNNTGMLVDLQFTGSGIGIENLLDISIGSTASSLSSALNAASLTNATTSVTEQENTGESALSLPIAPTQGTGAFLFSPRHLVKLTWGYIEDEKSVRNWVGSIIIVRSQFPSAGQPVTEITVHGAGSTFDQITPRSGKSFSVSTFAEKSIKEIVQEVCASAGYLLIISEDLGPSGEADTGKPIVWPAGWSLQQFFSRLASQSNCVYRTFYSPSTAKPVVQFIKRTEWYKYVFIPEKLFTYKGPQSILKSVDVKIDYGNNTSTYKKQITEDGKSIANKSNAKEETVILEGENLPNNNPEESNTADTAGTGIVEAVPNGKVAGNVEYVPDGTTAKVKANADASTGCPTSGNVMLEFSCLGYTKLTNVTIPIRGIGVRYSGNYTIQSITHTIDSSGYSCKGVAQKAGVGSGESSSSVPEITNISSQGSSSDEVTKIFEEQGIDTESESEGGVSITSLGL